MFLDINKRILLEDVGLQISNDNLLKKYVSKNTAVAMYDFASQDDNQLSLFCGRKIVVWTEDKGIMISNLERFSSYLNFHRNLLFRTNLRFRYHW